MAVTNISMTQAQFDSLRKVIYDRSGIHFPDTKKYVLESRLSRRLEELEFDSFTQYLKFLTMGPYQMDEFQEMFNRITINETSFFRNEPQLDVFEKRVLPMLLEARKDTKRLRFWSAACSTGEEPYTMAIQIHRTLGVRMSDWHIDILGTDISQKVLDVAQVGRYASYSVRSVNSLILQRYFTEANGFYQIDPTIQSMVNFERLNLRDSLAVSRFGTWDVIFCRNVMIYFDDAMKTHCAKLYHKQLAHDGALFIGHSESLRGIEVPFESVPIPQAFMYIKENSPLNRQNLGFSAADRYKAS